MLSLSELQSLTSVEEIKKLLPIEVIETLTTEDDGVIENALARATATVYATLLGCGVEDLNKEGKQVVKTALEKLTLYEISLYATVEFPFQKYKEEALKLLEAYFGCSKIKPAVVVRKDKRLKGLKIWELS